VSDATGSGGHETRDVSYKPIVAAGVGLAVATVVALLAAQLLMNVLAVRESRRSEPISPLAGAYGRRQPPEPRLQSHPLEDLRTLRAAEDASLHGYAWVDEQAGIMRIPIERAIEMLAARGLPAREQP
jgi:hypothetical protein